MPYIFAQPLLNQAIQAKQANKNYLLGAWHIPTFCQFSLTCELEYRNQVSCSFYGVAMCRKTTCFRDSAGYMIAIISDSNDILTDPHYLLRVQQGMSVNTNRFLSQVKKVTCLKHY